MPSYQDLFPDPRLAERAERIAAAMTQQQSVIIRRITEDRAEAAGAYRFFGNPNVSKEALTKALLHDCRASVQDGLVRGGQPRGGHALVLQDTTQLNYEHLAGRLGSEHGLGVIGDDESRGYFLHPSLAVDAETGACLGLSAVRLWTRPAERADKHERSYRAQPIEEKESFRWIESMVSSQAVLEEAEQITMVADRESDIFEVLARVPDGRTDVLVRVHANRRVSEPAGLLFDHVGEQAVAGRYRIEVRGDKRRDRQAREALIEVRYGPVHLRRPDRLGGSDYPEEVPEEGSLYVVEAKEAAATVPEGKQPIRWLLVTSHRVEDVETAQQVIAWYQQRWQIEQYFRLLKSEGLNLEGALLEDGAALRRLCLMALGAALQVMRLLRVRTGRSSQPASHVFTQSEQHCLEALMREWEGATRKQQNPHEAGTLAWASWLVARMGGWKGYASQHPPGPITYYRGMYRFASLYRGWRLAHA